VFQVDSDDVPGTCCYGIQNLFGKNHILTYVNGDVVELTIDLVYAIGKIKTTTPSARCIKKRFIMHKAAQFVFRTSKSFVHYLIHGYPTHIGNDQGKLAPSTLEEVQQQVSDYLNEDEYASLKWDHIEPPIDSSNLSPVHWSKMCSTMELCYKTASFGAVLLIHGTDTLAFTAAILDVLQLSNPWCFPFIHMRCPNTILCVNPSRQRFMPSHVSVWVYAPLVSFVGRMRPVRAKGFRTS